MLNKRSISIVICCMSLLLLLIYLPLLVWSPPWSHEGYYYQGPWLINGKPDDGPIIKFKPHYSFQNGYLKAHFFPWEPAPDIHRVLDLNVQYQQKNKHTWEYIDANAWTQHIHIDNAVISKPYTTDSTIIVQLFKHTNPFDIWYITWLEFTEEAEYDLEQALAE